MLWDMFMNVLYGIGLAYMLYQYPEREAFRTRWIFRGIGLLFLGLLLWGSAGLSLSNLTPDDLGLAVIAVTATVVFVLYCARSAFFWLDAKAPPRKTAP